MALPANLGAIGNGRTLDLTAVGNAMAIPVQTLKHVALALYQLGGSGAAIVVDGSRDNGATWIQSLSLTDYDLGTAITSVADDGDYRAVTHGYGYIQVRVVTAGTGSATVQATQPARALEVLPLGGSGGMASTVTDPALEAAAGAPGDASGANTLVGQAKALVNTFKTAIAVTINGMLPAGTNAIGTVGVTGTVAVSDPQNASYSTWPTIAPASGVYTPPAGMRGLAATVTTAGNIVLTDAANNVMTYPLSVGFQTIPYLPASFTSTATATFYGNK